MPRPPSDFPVTPIAMSRQPAASGNLPLFRDEALERFRATAWQRPLLSRPVSAWALTALALIAAAAFIAFAATFEFARKEQVRGYLTPTDGWSRVTAKSFGVVRRRLANPRDDVRVGDVLLEISSGDGVRQAVTVQDQMLEEIQGRRTALDERVHLVAREYEQETALLERAAEADRRELERLEEEIELARVRARIARQRYLDGVRLADSGALAPADTMRLEDDMQSQLLVLSERRRTVDRLRAPIACWHPGTAWSFLCGSMPATAFSRVRRCWTSFRGAASCRDGCSYRQPQWGSSNPARRFAYTWTRSPTNATAPSQGG